VSVTGFVASPSVSLGLCNNRFGDLSRDIRTQHLAEQILADLYDIFANVEIVRESHILLNVHLEL
jgi:hypothetical protein